MLDYEQRGDFVLTPIRRLEHPLAMDKIGRLRDQKTDVPTFRRLVYELTLFLAIECTADLRLEPHAVRTPLAATEAMRLADRVVLVPILRAGLGMVDAMLQVVPDAKVGHLGMFRDHETLAPTHYYANTPTGLHASAVILLDPMLATGGSSVAALSLLKGRGAVDVKFVSLIAAPEGIKRVQEAHPDVQLYTVAIDERLDDRGYIVPGLGDAGDRLFGTLDADE